MSGVLLMQYDSGVLLPLTVDGVPCEYTFGTEPKPKHSQSRASAHCRFGVMQAARQAFQQVARRSAQHVKGSRSMSSDASSEKAHLDEAMKEMSKWRTVTYAAVPTCIAVAAWDLSHQHEHHEEVPDYPYMRIRSKDFPWGPCGLFEMHCPEAEGGEE